MINGDYNLMKVAQVERMCKQQFGVNLHVREIVFDDVRAGKNSYATIFQADKHTMYVLLESDDPLTLFDVKGIMKSMGIEADAYMPPHGDETYFMRNGHQAFLSAYPGRKTETDQERMYYRTLSPYSPALVRIAKIGGEIRHYDTASPRWQKSDDYSYVRMKVQ